MNQKNAITFLLVFMFSVLNVEVNSQDGQHYHHKNEMAYATSWFILSKKKI